MRVSAEGTSEGEPSRLSLAVRRCTAHGDTHMSTKFVIPALATAKEVLALVEAKTVKREDALAFLQARVNAAVARGARVKFPTLKAIEQLTGTKPEAPKGATKLERLAANDAKRREVKLANLAKAREAKAAKAATTAKPSAPANPLDAVAKSLAAMDDMAMAAFMKLVFDARKKNRA